jgi:hypothetical protein
LRSPVQRNAIQQVSRVNSAAALVVVSQLVPNSIPSSIGAHQSLRSQTGTHGSLNFDARTKGNLVQSLLAQLKQAEVEQYIAYLIAAFENGERLALCLRSQSSIVAVSSRLCCCRCCWRRR